MIRSSGSMRSFGPRLEIHVWKLITRHSFILALTVRVFQYVGARRSVLISDNQQISSSLSHTVSHCGCLFLLCKAGNGELL